MADVLKFLSRNDSSAASAPDQLQTTRAALARAWGPSIGTICLSALVQALVGSLALALRGLRRVRAIYCPSGSPHIPAGNNTRYAALLPAPALHPNHSFIQPTFSSHF
jgi:hypothetical protein